MVKKMNNLIKVFSKALVLMLLGVGLFISAAVLIMLIEVVVPTLV